MFNGKNGPLPMNNGRIFLNRDWSVFKHVISYLRSNMTYEPQNLSKDEMRHYRAEMEFLGLADSSTLNSPAQISQNYKLIVEALTNLNEKTEI